METKAKVATRKFEDFTGKWGAYSTATGLKYVVLVDGVCYFEYNDGRIEKDEDDSCPGYKSTWTTEEVEFCIAAKIWREVFESE